MKRLRQVDARSVQEDAQPCCCTRSDKYWVTDPTGLAWETFHTLATIPVYGEDTAVFSHGESAVPAPTTGKSTGCVPTATSESNSERVCCGS
jgi:hypothetical protein